MAAEKNSVLYYTKAKVSVTVNFPEKNVSCNFCPFFHYSETYERGYCEMIRNGENVMSRKFAMSGIHPNCPLEFEEVT